MRLLFVLIVAVSGFVGCAPKSAEKTPKPKGLLKEKEMVEIMSDLQLIEAAKTMHHFNPDSVDQDKRRYMQEVYSKHNVSDTLFLKSLEYYSGKEKKMLEIYDKVIESLQTQQEDYR
ncbi:MAG: hypothetical protein ACI8ZO_001646 [Flavobacteriales bacterium]|jgi:hypothetical protein